MSTSSWGSDGGLGGWDPPPSQSCRACGSTLNPLTNMCPTCSGATFGSTSGAYGPLKSKMAAGLLGIFLGGIGVHSFYLGDNKKGVLQIVVTVLTCGFGSLWGFIEGIMILAGSIKTDAHGRPLAE